MAEENIEEKANAEEKIREEIKKKVSAAARQKRAVHAGAAKPGPQQSIYGLSKQDLEKLDETRAERFQKKIGLISQKFSKKAKYIIAALVVLAIAYFAYDYFVLSVKELSISVSDIEGKSIEGNHIKITDSSGNVVFDSGGTSTYLAKLRRGHYTISASALGFKSFSRELELSDAQTISIQLERDAALSIDSISIPEKLFIGQEFALNVTVKNDEAAPQLVRFELGDELKNFTCELSEVSVPAKEKQVLAVYCTIPDTIKMTDNCEQKNASVRIRGFKETKKQAFSLCKKPEIILPKEISFSVDPISKPKERKDFVIKNQSAFSVENLQLSIEITSIKENSIEDILKYFAFGNVVSEPRNVRRIPKIEAKQSISEPLEVSVPLSIKKEVIYGNVVLSAPFLKEPLKAKLTLDIMRTPKVDIRATLSAYKAVVVYRGDIPQESTIKLTITNNGDLTVNNIDVKIENPQECPREWLRPLDTLSVGSLEPRKVAQITLIASAPKESEKNTVKRCIISMSYENPIPPNNIETESVGFIEVVRG